MAEATDLLRQVRAAWDIIFIFHPWTLFSTFSITSLNAGFLDFENVRGIPKY